MKNNIQNREKIEKKDFEGKVLLITLASIAIIAAITLSVLLIFNHTKQQEETEEPVAVFVKDVSGNLNVRAKSQHESDLVYKVIDDDTELYYYGEVGEGYGSDGKMHEWYKIYVDGKEEGWVRSDLVRKK